MGERSSGGGSSDRRVSESKLEAELYESMRLLSMTEQGFPMPEREYRPLWCCQHRKGVHETFFKTDPRGHCRMCCMLDAACAHEYRRARNWRCDFAWPDRRLIVEVEGGVYTQGRHVRPSGFTKDLEKYNALTEAGWKVLRFSRREVTSGEALNVIQRVLNEAAVSG